MQKQLKKEKKMNPALWFLFAIIIPFFVLLAIAVVILSVSGVNVADWAKEKGNQVPVLASMIDTEEEQNMQQEEERMQAAMAEKDTEIETLSQEIASQESVIEQLEQEIVKLENRNMSTEQEEDAEEEQAPMQNISSSFQEMDTDQAALIMENLEEETALSILQHMSTQDRGAVLEAMNPETAANLTQLFINENE
ncbi:MotE family protein [Lentibacillus sediminis]|uniref:MotE family protein n=1 Tax=Lentibacillus sediminis TaxID=1940529 RepID=UPI000C1BA892|nr:hypothetical protein [Lentibacillus sediminis]